MDKSKIPWLKEIMEHSFWVGFYSAILLVLLAGALVGFVRGEWGPIKHAFEEAERDENRLERRQVQPDEQPDAGNGERG